MPAADLRLRHRVAGEAVEQGEHEEGDEEIITARELAYCHAKRRSGQHLAARFAAKEAVLKAFGTGVSRRMRWTEVEVINDRLGRPEVRLEGAVAEFARRRGLAGLDVSLTHTEGLAIAHAASLWEGAQCGST